MEERRADPLLHHRVRDFHTQREVFEKLPSPQPRWKTRSLPFAILTVAWKQPFVITAGLFGNSTRPRVTAEALFPHEEQKTKLTSNRHALREAIEEAKERIDAAEKPVIIAGVEMHRFGLREEVLNLAEKSIYPWLPHCWANRSSVKASSLHRTL